MTAMDSTTTTSGENMTGSSDPDGNVLGLFQVR
jgi:hypothetical protein